MKILITSIGTRGDVEPFLAIGYILHKRGHEIRFAFPAQYCNMVEHGIPYDAYSPEFLELLDSAEGRDVMTGSSGLGSKFMTYYKLLKNSMPVNRKMAAQQYSFIQSFDPDLVIHHPKCVYPPIWRDQPGKKAVMISPVPYYLHYHPDGNNLGFGVLPKFLRKLSYRLGNFGLSKMVVSLSKQLDLKSDISGLYVLKQYLSQPFAYTISPSLFKPFEGWPTHVRVLGYHERSRTLDWAPSAKLQAFLKKYSKIAFLSFGSMINKNPKRTTEIFIKIFSDLQIPAIINTGGGGLVKTDNTPDHIFFTESIPYEWILPRMYAAIHHGGSGTIHMSLKYGCATMIIPHIIDQYVWNEKNVELGTGPKGPAINKINYDKLKSLVEDLWSNKNYKSRAAELSMQMKNENMEEELCTFLIGEE